MVFSITPLSQGKNVNEVVGRWKQGDGGVRHSDGRQGNNRGGITVVQGLRGSRAKDGTTPLFDCVVGLVHSLEQDINRSACKARCC